MCFIWGRESCSGSENGTTIRKTTLSALLYSILIDTQTYFMVTSSLSQWPLDRNDQEPLDRPKPPAQHRARAVRLTEQGSTSPECFGKKYWLLLFFFFVPRDPPLTVLPQTTVAFQRSAYRWKWLILSKYTKDLVIWACGYAALPFCSHAILKSLVTQAHLCGDQRGICGCGGASRSCLLFFLLSSFFFLARHNLMENFESVLVLTRQS